MHNLNGQVNNILLFEIYNRQKINEVTWDLFIVIIDLGTINVGIYLYIDTNLLREKSADTKGVIIWR